MSSQPRSGDLLVILKLVPSEIGKVVNPSGLLQGGFVDEVVLRKTAYRRCFDFLFHLLGAGQS